MRPRVALPLTGLVLVLGVGVLAPAEATGGPPTITSLSPNPVTVNGTLTVSGTGCNASSPVSFRLWDTGGGPTKVVNGLTTTGAGAFTHGVALAGTFGAGTEVGVVAVCQPTFTETGMSNAVADDSYVLISLPDPVVDVSVPATAVFASSPTVTVTTSDAPGSLHLRLDGSEIYAASTGFGSHSVQLPASLTLGTHTLAAEFDPLASGAPTVTDTATVEIVKAASTVVLSRPNRHKVQVGKKVKLTVALGSAGLLVGAVVVKDGRKVLRTILLEVSDNGTESFRVKMRKTGKRKLTAYFAGSAYVAPSTSPKVVVKVVD